MKLFLSIALFALVACVSTNNTPEGALQDFVEARIGKVVDREFILERVTGKMLQSFENMSDEDFLKFSDMSNVKTDSFKVLSKSCTDKKCFVTYSVGYLTKKDDKVVFSSEVKKIAEVLQVGAKWLIADVSNIKTYHESLESINALE